MVASPEGEYYAELAKEGGNESLTKDFLKNSRGEIADLREMCSACLTPVPQGCDLSLQVIGHNMAEEISVEAGTDKGKEAVAKLNLKEASNSGEREKEVKELIEARKKKFDEIGEELKGFLSLVSAKCINCQNCRKVCPLCYCKQCIFEGPILDYEGDKYMDWASRKRTLKMPTDTYLFHLTRMNHMLASCVGCGQCEEACPNDLPVGRVFYALGRKIQDLFGYEAGRNLTEELPLNTFKEEELQVVED